VNDPGRLRIAEHFIQVAYARALGLRLVALTATGCEMAVPYADHLIGDPDTGVIHGGVVTALLDNVSGLAAFPQGSDQRVAVATLDMRIDYLAAAQPGREIHARADCYRRTQDVAFVRACAFHESAEEPIAVCNATFMVGTPNVPLARPAP